MSQITQDRRNAESAGLTRASEILNHVRNLPPMSGAVRQLLALNPGDPALLEKALPIVESDAALAAQIVRIANSAAFSGQVQIDGLERALMRVGVRMIVGTVAQSQMQKVFEPTPGVMSHLWLSAAYTSHLAMQITLQHPIDGLVAEHAYLHGLLHDIGRLVMAILLGDSMKELLAEHPNIRTELCRRERALFGFDHQMAGRLLGNRWQLPVDQTAVIASHHERRRGGREHLTPQVAHIMSLLALVDELAHFALVREEAGDDVASTLPTHLESPDVVALYAALDLTRKDIEKCIEPALQGVARQRELMGIATVRA